MRRLWYDRWQVFLACGVAMTLGSAFVFWDLTEWETHPNESRSMPWFAALVYRIGGKWLLSGLVLGVGLFLMFEGMRRRRVQLRPDQRVEDAPAD
ncbi:MAG TPA: hypothetical protein VKD90_01775 [Gemmataceae bacterium]|nr:hypothetical protein [Gemmataceae bacterium]